MTKLQEAQSTQTQLKQIPFECNSFSGPYQLNYVIFLFGKSRCNHWRGWKRICFLIYLCKLGLLPVAADDCICLSGVADLIGLQPGCWEIVCVSLFLKVGSPSLTREDISIFSILRTLGSDPL